MLLPGSADVPSARIYSWERGRLVRMYLLLGARTSRPHVFTPGSADVPSACIYSWERGRPVRTQEGHLQKKRIWLQENRINWTAQAPVKIHDYSNSLSGYETYS